MITSAFSSSNAGPRALRGCVLLLFAFMLLAVFLPGCKKKEEAAQAQATNAPPPPPPPKKEEPPTEFKAKWPIGKRMVQRTQTDADLSITRPGTPDPVKIETHQTQEHALSVLREREGGGLELELEFLSQKMDNRIPGMAPALVDTRNDAKSDRTNAMQLSLRKTVGAKIKYQTAPDGKVAKMDGAPLLRSKLASGAAPQNLALFNQMFGDDVLKSLIDIHVGLPDHPVKPGDTWELKRDQPGAGGVPMVINVTTTFTGWEERGKQKCAVFELAGSVTNKPGPGPMGATISIESGKITGKSVFHPELGIYLESTADMEISMKTTYAALQGQSVGSAIKQKVGTQLRELTELAGGPNLITPPAEKAPAPKPVEAPKTADASKPAEAAPMTPPAPKPAAPAKAVGAAPNKPK